MSHAKKVVLASTSAPRRILMERLGIPFETARPEMDETPLPGESAVDLVLRLAVGKAQSIVAHWQEPACIIGSDQVAVCDGEILGKPLDHPNAVRQLRRLSGKTIVFYTGLALVDVGSGRVQVDQIPCSVTFRQLSDAMIENYLRLEAPYQCAGSFKSERLGVALMDKLEGNDPNSLIGLPLIRLVRMLENEGIRLI